MWRKGKPSALLVGMQTGAATVENSIDFLKKLKMELPFDLVILLLGLYPKNPETPNPKGISTFFVTRGKMGGKVEYRIVCRFRGQKTEEVSV